MPTKNPSFRGYLFLRHDLFLGLYLLLNEFGSGEAGSYCQATTYPKL
jgi:hypothetical protein